MTRAILVAVLLAAGGCGGPAPVAFRLESAQPWALAPDALGRLEALTAAGSGYWGGDLSSLDGWTVAVRDGMVSCGGWPSVGCADSARHTITISATDNIASPTVICAEGTGLAHEIGHVIIGDPQHQDPRWDRRSLNDMAAALVPTGDLACLAWFEAVLY